MDKTRPQTTGANVKVANYVHQDTIHGENIRKEMRYADKNIMKHFQLNPHHGTFSPLSLKNNAAYSLSHARKA